MGALFNGSSAVYTNSLPYPMQATGYPFTMGCWVLFGSVGTAQTVIQVTSSSASANYATIGTSTTAWQLAAGATTVSVGTPAAGVWYFVLARFSSATNRTLSIIGMDGTVIQDTASATSKTFASINRLGLGFRSNGSSLGNYISAGSVIAEAWWTSTDIAGDVTAATTPAALIRQIAFQGPYSVPSVAASIVEYRALRSSLGADTDRPDEYGYGPGGRTAWAADSTMLLGQHPPLPLGYVRPNANPRPQEGLLSTLAYIQSSGTVVARTSTAMMMGV